MRMRRKWRCASRRWTRRSSEPECVSPLTVDRVARNNISDCLPCVPADERRVEQQSHNRDDSLECERIRAVPPLSHKARLVTPQVLMLLLLLLQEPPRPYSTRCSSTPTPRPRPLMLPTGPPAARSLPLPPPPLPLQRLVAGSGAVSLPAHSCRGSCCRSSCSQEPTRQSSNVRLAAGCEGRLGFIYVRDTQSNS